MSSCIANKDRSDSTGELLSYGETSPLEALLESVEECLPPMENGPSDRSISGLLIEFDKQTFVNEQCSESIGKAAL